LAWTSLLASDGCSRRRRSSRSHVCRLSPCCRIGASPTWLRIARQQRLPLSLMAFQNPRTGRGAAFLVVRSRHASVLYVAPASISPTSIEAYFGAIGRVDVDFVPSGRSRTERSICGGTPVSVDSGRYEGSIDFEGEEGYSEVHADSARGEAKMALSVLCAGRPSWEGTGSGLPGARLIARHRGDRRFEFRAMKNGPDRPARFTASISENRGELEILRSVEIAAAPGSFDFDVPSGVARVSPPRPFAGEATYQRGSGKSASWQGNLSVDFPGRADLRLTGSDTRASLVRAAVAGS